MKLKRYSNDAPKIKTFMFNLFLSLFTFTSFNREFVLGGWDLRYLGFFLEMILILLYFAKCDGKVHVNKDEKKLLLFYILMILSNISWLWNDISFNGSVVVNLWILNIYNFLALLVFIFYKSLINKERLYKTILISNVVLVASMLWVFCGYELPSFFSTGARTITLDSGTGEHLNIFGQGVRVAGFAEDANYASFFAMIAIAISLVYVKDKLKKAGLIILFGISLGLSFSRTIILAVLIAFGIFLLRILLKKGSKIYNYILIYGIVLACIIIPFIDYGEIMSTLSTRFLMWRSAADLFLRNIFLGNGVGSFRCYFSSLFVHDWYVQCHSTWWQVLSENGLVALGILLSFLYKKVSKCKENYKLFILILLIVLACTYEIIYLQVFVLVVYVLLNETQKSKDMVKDER